MQLFKQALAILMIITLMPMSSLPTYADNSDYNEQGQKLFNLGILVGDNNDLRLNDSLNRYEGLILAIRLAGKEDIAKAFDISSFDEIIADEVPFWAKHYVQYALLGDLNITKGVDKLEDGRTIFGGNQKLNALQFSTFVLKGTGHEVPDWRLSLNQLVKMGVLSNDEVLELLDGSFTRGKAAFLIDRMLSKMSSSDGQPLIENLIKTNLFTRDLANANGYAKELSITNVGLNSFNIISSKELNVYSAEFKGTYDIRIDGHPIGHNDYRLELQSDQKTVYLDIQNKIKQNSKVDISINNMLDINKEKLEDISYSAESTDNFGASIISTEWMDKNSILIKFNEKIKSNDVKAYLNDTPVVSIIQTSDRELFLLLNDSLIKDQKYTVRLDYVSDSVNYKKNLTSSFTTTTKDLTMQVRNITTNGYDMVFNQRIKDEKGQLISDVYSTDYRNFFSLSFQGYHPSSVTTLDGFRIRVEYDQLIPFGTANFYITPSYENRYLVDANGSKIKEDYHTKTFLPIDRIAPKVVGIEKLDNNHFKLNINEATSNATITSNYSLIDNNAKAINISKIEKINDTTLIFTTGDLDNKEIALSVTNLIDVYGNKSATQIISLTGELSKDAPVVLTTGYYSKDEMKIEIRFSKNMNESILNPNNYLFDGKNITGISIQAYESNRKVIISLNKKLIDLSPERKLVVKRVQDSYGNQSKYDLTTVQCIPSNITKSDLSDVKIYATDNRHIIFETSTHLASIDFHFVYLPSVNIQSAELGYSNKGSVIKFKTSNAFNDDISDIKSGQIIFDKDALRNPLDASNLDKITFDHSIIDDLIPPRIIKVTKTSANTLSIETNEPIVAPSATYDKFSISGNEIADISIISNIITVQYSNNITTTSILIKEGLYDKNGNVLNGSKYYDF